MLLNHSYSKFLLQLTIFSTASGITLYYWNQLMPTYSSVHWKWILTGFAFFTAVMHYFLLEANKKSPQHFTRMFMAFSAIKMFSCMMLILAYGVMNKPQAIGFAINVILLYIPFLILEVITLLKYFKK